jgi:large subunit ribosomal protein L23
MAIANNVLIEAVLTEKASDLAANVNQYTFKVYPQADSFAIKNAVEETFDVTVTRVNTLTVKPKSKSDRNRRGKKGIKSGYKKAIVTLKEGDKIELI